MSSLRLALKQSLAESTQSQSTPTTERSKECLRDGRRKRRDRIDSKTEEDDLGDGGSTDENEMEFGHHGGEHTSSGAEDPVGPCGSEGENLPVGTSREAVPFSPMARRPKHRPKKVHLANRCLEADEGQSPARLGTLSMEKSPELALDVAPLHSSQMDRFDVASNEGATRGPHESPSDHHSMLQSPVRKKKRREDVPVIASAGAAKKEAFAAQTPDIRNVGDPSRQSVLQGTEAEALAKKIKKASAHTVPKPLPDVLSWVRSMSVNKQRRHIKIGHRVKVRKLLSSVAIRFLHTFLLTSHSSIHSLFTLLPIAASWLLSQVQFATGTKKNGNRRLRWFGGQVLEVLPNGRRIRIRYDDGTIEVCDYPDNDIIVDAHDNGQHSIASGDHDSPLDPFIPSPRDDADDDASLSQVVKPKKMRTKSAPSAPSAHSTPHSAAQASQDNTHTPTDQTQLLSLDLSHIKFKKKKRKKSMDHGQACVQVLVRPDLDASSTNLDPTNIAQGTSLVKHQTLSDYAHSEHGDPDKSNNKSKKKLRLKLSISAASVTSHFTTTIQDVLSNEIQIGEQHTTTTTGSPRVAASKKPKKSSIDTRTLTLDNSAANLDADSETTSHDVNDSVGLHLLSSEPSSVKSLTHSLDQLPLLKHLDADADIASNTKLRIKIGTDARPRLEKSPNSQRLKIDLKKLSDISPKPRKPQLTPSSTKSAKERVSDPTTPRLERPDSTRHLSSLETDTKSSPTSPRLTADVKVKISPAGSTALILPKASFEKKSKTSIKPETPACDYLSPHSGLSESNLQILTPGSVADAAKLGRQRVRKKPIIMKPKKQRRRVEETPDSNRDGGPDADFADANWVQCDACQKWRLLPDSADMDALPERWFCQFNKYDKKRMSCQAPEQTVSEVVREREKHKLTPRKRKKKAVSREKSSPPVVPSLDSISNDVALGINLPALPLDTFNPLNLESADVSLGAPNDQSATDPRISLQPRCSPDAIDTLEKNVCVHAMIDHQGLGVEEIDTNSDCGTEHCNTLIYSAKPKKKDRECEKNSDESVKEDISSSKGVVDSQEWVQCEKCNKWRRLPPRIRAEDLPEVWYCTMNTWDIRVATCAAPEDFAETTARDKTNILGGAEKSGNTSKLSYRNLIFGTAGKRQTRLTSERARAADSIFIAPPRDEAGDYHPTVQYANSSCFVHRGMAHRTKAEEATGVALMELMSGTRLWSDLWALQGQPKPSVVSPTPTSDLVSDHHDFSTDALVVSDSHKALVFQAMSSKSLSKYEILLEVQCRDWISTEARQDDLSKLRSSCNIRWIDRVLNSLIKDGLVHKLENDGSFRFKKVTSPPAASSTRCVKLAKPWKTSPSDCVHWTDTQECEELLQQSHKRFEFLRQTLGPDPAVR